MSSLRYVGSSPGADNAVVTRSAVRAYIDRSIPNLTPAGEQAEARGAFCPSQSEVSALISTYATNSAVTTEANKYYSTSDVGSSIASLTSGKLPKTQWPAGFTEYLEPSGVVYNTGTTARAANPYNNIQIASVTVSNPGFRWTPFITGHVEFNVSGRWTCAALRVLDASSRVVAEGYSSMGGDSGSYTPAFLGMKNSYAYTGSQTFRVMIAIAEGSGSAQTTGWAGETLIVPVPN